eukprot:COSAG02_NODE_4421_length_5377_cov_4.815839_6_plen_86_part_00
MPWWEYWSCPGSKPCQWSGGSALDKVSSRTQNFHLPWVNLWCISSRRVELAETHRMCYFAGVSFTKLQQRCICLSKTRKMCLSIP